MKRTRGSGKLSVRHVVRKVDVADADDAGSDDADIDVIGVEEHEIETGSVAKAALDDNGSHVGGRLGTREFTHHSVMDCVALLRTSGEVTPFDKCVSRPYEFPQKPGRCSRAARKCDYMGDSPITKLRAWVVSACSEGCGCVNCTSMKWYETQILRALTDMRGIGGAVISDDTLAKAVRCFHQRLAQLCKQGRQWYMSMTPLVAILLTSFGISDASPPTFTGDKDTRVLSHHVMKQLVDGLGPVLCTFLATAVELPADGFLKFGVLANMVRHAAHAVTQIFVHGDPGILCRLLAMKLPLEVPATFSVSWDIVVSALISGWTTLAATVDGYRKWQRNAQFLLACVEAGYVKNRTLASQAVVWIEALQFDDELEARRELRAATCEALQKLELCAGMDWEALRRQNKKGFDATGAWKAEEPREVTQAAGTAVVLPRDVVVGTGVPVTSVADKPDASELEQQVALLQQQRAALAIQVAAAESAKAASAAAVDARVAQAALRWYTLSDGWLSPALQAWPARTVSQQTARQFPLVSNPSLPWEMLQAMRSAMGMPLMDFDDVRATRHYVFALELVHRTVALLERVRCNSAHSANATVSSAPVEVVEECSINQ
jgi:hypothetical protein